MHKPVKDILLIAVMITVIYPSLGLGLSEYDILKQHFDTGDSGDIHFDIYATPFLKYPSVYCVIVYYKKANTTSEYSEGYLLCFDNEEIVYMIPPIDAFDTNEWYSGYDSREIHIENFNRFLDRKGVVIGSDYVSISSFFIYRYLRFTIGRFSKSYPWSEYDAYICEEDESFTPDVSTDNGLVIVRLASNVEEVSGDRYRFLWTLIFDEATSKLVDISYEPAAVEVNSED
jgi:hypothetical protein